jgi:hypothetical protein
MEVFNPQSEILSQGLPLPLSTKHKIAQTFRVRTIAKVRGAHEVGESITLKMKQSDTPWRAINFGNYIFD